MRYWRVRYRRTKYIEKSQLRLLRSRMVSQMIIDEPLTYFKTYYCEITMNISIDLGQANLRGLLEEIMPQHEPLQIIDAREVTKNEAKSNQLDWVQVYPLH